MPVLLSPLPPPPYLVQDNGVGGGNVAGLALGDQSRRRFRAFHGLRLVVVLVVVLRGREARFHEHEGTWGREMKGAERRKKRAGEGTAGATFAQRQTQGKRKRGATHSGAMAQEQPRPEKERDLRHSRGFENH